MTLSNKYVMYHNILGLKYYYTMYFLTNYYEKQFTTPVLLFTLSLSLYSKLYYCFTFYRINSFHTAIKLRSKTNSKESN